jgi:hypothetical protein
VCVWVMAKAGATDSRGGVLVRQCTAAKQSHSVGGGTVPGFGVRGATTYTREKASSDGNGGAIQTCDLLVVDRSIDTVAPVIHEWTYEAMCYDLLPITDNQFSYTTKSTAGKDQKKVVMLGDHDPLWSELRCTPLASRNRASAPLPSRSDAWGDLRETPLRRHSAQR